VKRQSLVNALAMRRCGHHEERLVHLHALDEEARDRVTEKVVALIELDGMIRRWPGSGRSLRHRLEVLHTDRPLFNEPTFNEPTFNEPTFSELTFSEQAAADR
jgi:hypothetical protein